MCSREPSSAVLPNGPFVASDNAADNSAGTGARTLSSKFINATGAEVNAQISLLGTSQVALPELSVGVFSFEVETSGSLDTNAGNITVVDGSANVYAIIETGKGLSQIAVIRCPDNKRGEIIKHSASYSKPIGNSDASIFLNKRKTDGTIVTLWEAFLSVIHTEDFKEYLNGELPLEPGEFLFWKCISVSGNNTPIKAYFDIEFEDLDI